MSRPAALDSGVIDEAIAGSPWSRHDDELTCERSFGSFAAALGFVVSVGALAEAADHHPMIELRYRTVRLELSTHDVGSLTQLDLDLARAIDQL